MNTEEVLTLEQAAQFLKISYRTILRLVKRSELPVFRVGRQWRIKAEDLTRHINRGKKFLPPDKYLVHFNPGVMQRYRRDPEYYCVEDERGGKFGYRKEFLDKVAPRRPFLALLTDVPFEKVTILGGRAAIRLEYEVYSSTVMQVPQEYQHWHTYRIHRIKPDTDTAGG